ncbi:MAG: hypothetical protein ACLF0G_08800 [Candidatus Brocadiia bacterium]
MAGLWKRRLARHANALSFWAVVALVALMLSLVTAMVRRAQRPADYVSEDVRR